MIDINRIYICINTLFILNLRPFYILYGHNHSILEPEKSIFNTRFLHSFYPMRLLRYLTSFPAWPAIPTIIFSFTDRCRSPAKTHCTLWFIRAPYYDNEMLSLKRYVAHAVILRVTRLPPKPFPYAASTTRAIHYNANASAEA